MISTKVLNFRVGLFTAARLMVNTSFRMVYPFIAVFAHGLDVEIEVISIALAISMVTSALGPFLAPIADRRGRKAGMLIGLIIFLVGIFSASLFPGLATFFLAILLGNLGNNIFLPAMQAYLGDHTPYLRRGSYLAITELSWALSFILLVPLAGLLLANTTWNGPFIGLSVIGLIMTLLVWRFIPQDAPEKPESLTILSDIQKVLVNPTAILGMLMGTAFIAGNELISVVFGVWMQDSFGLQVAALGVASAVIGFSELGGEGLSALLVDRIGKEKMIAASLIVNSAWVIMLPGLSQSLTGSFIWLFVFYLTFEVAIVCTLPMMTEVMPNARATMMALYIAALSLGRAAGDVAAPFLYKNGFMVNVLVSVGLNLIAVFLLRKIRFPADPLKTRKVETAK
ncbi:MAG: MFS transporter [Chloroflexi bacterium]|nr:MFS transporter [Chloroflexota bacterium]